MVRELSRWAMTCQFLRLTPWKINMEPKNLWVVWVVEENRLPVWSIFRFPVGLFRCVDVPDSVALTE